MTVLRFRRPHAGMEEKRPIDLFGTVALTGFAALLAFNQVVIKIAGDGFNPLFQAGLRSVIGFGALWLWIRIRQGGFERHPPQISLWGCAAGGLFAFEFICLYIALDIGHVSRVSIFFYSMPVWLALAAHLFLPGERLNATRGLGLVLAMCGVALALADRNSLNANLTADLLALGAAFGWGGIALLIRMTPLATVSSVSQLQYQLLVSAPIMLVLSPMFGPALRVVEPVHLAALLFQAICIASFGYLAWFQLIKIYRASSVASFSFLSPVLAVLMGWLLLGEQVGTEVWTAMILVAGGVVLINRR